MELWTSKVRPILEYGCEIWEGEAAVKWTDKFESLQYSYCKAFLRLKGNPAAVGTRAELGLPTLQSRRRERKLRFWAKLCSADHSQLFSLVFRRRHAAALADAAQQSCLLSFKSLLHDVGLGVNWNDQCEYWQ